MDTVAYKKYFTTLTRKEKHTFLVEILSKVQDKALIFKNLAATLKQNTTIPKLFLDTIFEKIITFISRASQQKKEQSMKSLQDIHDKIKSIQAKEKQEKKKETEDVEAILDQISE